jgi:hypothetical protein
MLDIIFRNNKDPGHQPGSLLLLLPFWLSFPTGNLLSSRRFIDVL